MYKSVTVFRQLGYQLCTSHTVTVCGLLEQRHVNGLVRHPIKKNIYRKEIKRERKKDRKKKKTNKQANKQKTATTDLRLLSSCTIFLVEATVH